MTLMGWLREKLVGSPSRDLFREAIVATDEVTNKARSIREQIQPYALGDDPFYSILSRNESAHVFEQDQERRIFEGPP